MRTQNAYDGLVFGSPQFKAAQEAEIASRPRALPRPGPLSPAEIELHRQRGEAVRAANSARDAATKQAWGAEVARIDGLIRSAEHERRITAIEQSHSPAHLRGMETRG